LGGEPRGRSGRGGFLALQAAARPARVSPDGENRDRSGTQRAVAELERVEQELGAARERRRRMDIAEARLWKRRNELEQNLISTLGADWWREHAQGDGATTTRLG
jgi:hypothetical protein